jgi:hypothetical protein
MDDENDSESSNLLVVVIDGLMNFLLCMLF